MLVVLKWNPSIPTDMKIEVIQKVNKNSNSFKFVLVALPLYLLLNPPVL